MLDCRSLEYMSQLVLVLALVVMPCHADMFHTSMPCVIGAMRLLPTPLLYVVRKSVSKSRSRSACRFANNLWHPRHSKVLFATWGGTRTQQHAATLL